jgi:predicted ABC-type ATPase
MPAHRMRLLDDKTLDWVYVDLVRPLLFEDLLASVAPELIIVGGQPGAGKTAATLQAVRDLTRQSGGVVHINGDELRPFHPQYAALVAADRSTAADKTGADVGVWVARAVQEAAAGRFDTVLETTLRQPEVLRATVEQFTAQGFGFELRVVVVDPEASQLGIYERFAAGLASPSALPRFTLPSYHADALAQMPKTLAVLAKLAKLVRFVDRNGRELYSSRISKVSPVKALQDVRRQPLPDAERQRIALQWAALVQRLDRDGVPDRVRQGLRFEQARFTALQQQGRGASSGPTREGLDR